MTIRQDQSTAQRPPLPLPQQQPLPLRRNLASITAARHIRPRPSALPSQLRSPYATPSTYMDGGPHWRTRLFGVIGTSCICLLMVGASLSWNGFNAALHHRSAPLSVMQWDSPADDLADNHASTPTPPTQNQDHDQDQDQDQDQDRPPPAPASAASLPTPLPPLQQLSAPDQSTRPATPNAPAVGQNPPISAQNPSSQRSASATAPSPSNSASRNAMPPSTATQSSWEGLLLRHLEKHRRYPAAARLHGQEGVVHIRFSMNRSGQLLRATVVQSSRSSLLDRAALDTLRRAQPLPTIPADLPDPLEITIPVEFFIGH